MKRILLLSWLVLAMPGLSRAAAPFYINDAIVLVPPQIDATNFINNNIFQADNFSAPYETSSTVYYTNFGQMSSSLGFRFETSPPGPGVRRQAGTLFNSGSITCGAKLLASATNILIPGDIDMGYESLLSLKGRTIDLDRGTVTSQTSGFNFIFNGTTFFTVFSSGINDGYWNAGTANGSNVQYLFPNNFNTVPSSTPFHLVTNRDYFSLITSLFPPNQVPYVSEVFTGPSNRVVSAVFLGNANPAFTLNVYFPFTGDIWVEWKSLITNSAGQLVTNWLYLRDTFGVFTNVEVAVNGAGGGLIHPTYKPVNYTFFQGDQIDLGSPAPSGLPGGTFDTSRFFVTNQFAAYEALFEVTTRVLSDVAGQDITNVPGRVEITAEGSLNLSRTHIDSLNYLSLQATNHFVSSSRAQITSPWSDLNLRSTNGLLAITNLLYPTVPRPEGTVDLWSGRWTNVVNDITNSYNVLFVDSRLNPTAPARVQDLILCSTNTAGGAGAGGSILISDIMSVSRTLWLDTERLTLMTNAPGSLVPSGEIDLLSFDIIWSSATPRLQYLTNNGTISSGNAAFFGGARTSPYYSTSPTDWYSAFVNRGFIFNQNTHIFANYFENTGLLSAGIGSIALQSRDALLADGFFLATSGDISITSGSLVVSNHTLQSGRVLSFTVTDLLDDGSLSNAVGTISKKNTWTAGDGINLFVRPARASLLGTTISTTAQPGREVFNRWAADDLGCSSAGFNNNAALGRLILDGGNDSLFTFHGTGVSNAIYVDSLEFPDYTTTTIINAAGDVEEVQIDPNMKIYYAQAMAVDGSVAERINGANGGKFCWVPAYAGFYSSTNLVYPGETTTNTFNAALVGSCNVDSDGDGVVNCVDLTPIFRAQDVMLTVTLTNVPLLSAQLAWQSVPSSTNYLEFKPALTATNWTALTNVIAGSGPGPVPVFVSDPLATNVTRFYRVRVDVNQP